MSLETSAARIIGTGLIDAAGGSIVIFGAICLIGIAILMKKLEMGLSSGLMIVILILGVLAEYYDSRNVGVVFLGNNIHFFRLLYLALVLGAALYWAIFLRRR